MAKTILIVEDDTFLLRIIKKKLLKGNYNVIEAIDGEQGIKIINKEKPDLVLLDLILPGIDGFEVLAKMKADSKMAKIPVIVLSNLGEKEQVKKGLKMGANDYLVKAHFTPEEIIKRIEAALK